MFRERRSLRQPLLMKLLELSKQNRRLTLEKLAQELHAAPSTISQSVERLSKDGFVSFDEILLELDDEQRIKLAQELVHSGRDPQIVSRYLDWQEFEDFAVRSLEENGFNAKKHVTFKTRKGRREIDILAWNDNLILALDCKHWLRGGSAARMKTVGEAQFERAKALADRPELLTKLGIPNSTGRSILPMIFALGEPRQTVVNGIPIVSVPKLVSFLYGISPVDESFRKVRVKAHTKVILFGEPKA